MTLTCICCLLSAVLSAQTNSSSAEKNSSVYESMALSVAGLQPDFQTDTTSLPDDSITSIIRELRRVRGNFNVNEMIAMKIEEARQKKDITQSAADSLSAYFTSGPGKKKLDNAVMWIYRQHFTYAELQDILAFYKTPAGQKFAAEFPLVILESLKAAEMIQLNYTGGKQK